MQFPPPVRYLRMKYDRKTEPLYVDVGVRPSGNLHLGNLITIMIAAGILRKPEVTTRITICDTDRPDAGDWSIKDTGHVRHFNTIPDPLSQETTLAKRVTSDIKELIPAIEKQYENKISLQMLSDVTKDIDFRNGIKRVLETKGLIDILFQGFPGDHVPVYPICPECETSNYFPSRYSEGYLHTKCVNNECSKYTIEYKVALEDTSADIAFHVFMNISRGCTVNPRSHIHILGGDYLNMHTGDGPKSSKIDLLLDVASIEGYIPDIFVGPKLVDTDGNELSKSSKSKLTINLLKEQFGSMDNVVMKTHECLLEIMKTYDGPGKKYTVELQ